MDKFKIIDLFCGAGGLSAGFLLGPLKQRFQGVLAIDQDASSIQTHNLNFGDYGLCTDLETWLQTQDVPKADLVIGGPPCQGFSLLNKERRGDHRRALWEPYLEVVARSSAQVFVMENVPGLLGSEEFGDIQDRAQALGFRVRFAKLNAADYGAPQVRKRAIVIGCRRELMEHLCFPPPATHADPKLASHLPTWRTVGSVIDDLEPPVGQEIRDCSPPYDLHFGRNPTAKSLARYRLIPEGGNRFDLQRLAPQLTPNCWLNKPSGGTDLFGRLWRNRPSVTIRTEFFKPEKGRYLHPDQDRPITHREAARIMGFPDSFKFCGNKQAVARQIGNAVPPPLAQALAGAIIAMLEGELLAV